MFSTKFLGLIAEIYVCIYYVIRLYKPVAWRFKLHKFGEIDWVFKKANNLIFVEVKFRKSIVDLQNIVNIKQSHRIIKMSQIFLKHHSSYNGYFSRFDLMVVNNFKIIRFTNIWNDTLK